MISRGRGFGGNRARPFGRGARGVFPQKAERTPSSTAATTKNPTRASQKSPKKKPKKRAPRRETDRKDTQPCVSSGVGERHARDATASPLCGRSLPDDDGVTERTPSLASVPAGVQLLPSPSVACLDNWRGVSYHPPTMVYIASISGAAVTSILNESQ